ncbi:hypothetical protein F4823DRAFT_558536 [Ustulina deusta]|nr:hypothetical protein F4823DRAFT_558536 [Ustulina deusta]
MADGVRWCASPLDAEVEEGHQAARRLLTLLNGFKKRIGDFARRLRPGSSLRRLSRDVLWPLLEKEMGEVMERVTQLNVVDRDDTELSKDNIIPTDLLIEYCSGLVVIEPESKIVRFVHSITQEYFEAEENTPLFASTDGSIALTCITLSSFHDPVLNDDATLPGIGEVHNATPFLQCGQSAPRRAAVSALHTVLRTWQVWPGAHHPVGNLNVFAIELGDFYDVACRIILMRATPSA